jgi:NAD(P)-dependent dehydrogenase (short-subunit alcohol dehydrogenase family)
LKKFNGRVVLITGASSGIGKQVAIDFANNGARTVVLVARSARSLQGSKFSSAGNYGSLLF